MIIPNSDKNFPYVQSEKKVKITSENNQEMPIFKLFSWR